MLREETVRKYVERFLTPELSILSGVRDMISAAGLEHEEIRKSQLAFLQCLVAAVRPRKILELGTFFGYSTLGMAYVIQSCSIDGQIISVDHEEQRSAAAGKLIASAGYSDIIELFVADDHGACLDLAAKGERFDIVFLDTNERNYPRLYSPCIDLLRTGGLLVVDNALMLTANDWATGKNIVESGEEPELKALAECMAKAFKDDRTWTSVVPIGVGLLLCVRR